VEHYRPISLCNTSYKLVTKILIRRLKGILNDLISPEQGAFVPGRSISDKILVAQEITHSLEDSHGADHYNVHMKKMQWDFINHVLFCFGFDDTFNGCIRDDLFSVLVNGSLTEFFASSMGLRQGCPLSPYLFILGSEKFSARIRQLEAVGCISGFKPCPQSLAISHLLFADDYLLICNAGSINALPLVMCCRLTVLI